MANVLPFVREGLRWGRIEQYGNKFKSRAHTSSLSTILPPLSPPYEGGEFLGNEGSEMYYEDRRFVSKIVWACWLASLTRMPILG